MGVQWHRVDHTTAPLGHALVARVDGRSWLAYELDDGSWRLEGTEPPTRPVVVNSLTEVRRRVEPEETVGRGSRRRNGAGLGAFLGSIVGGALGGIVGPGGALLGSVAGGGVGGSVGAQRDRKKRGAIGGTVGGVVGPLGAALGGYIGGRKPDEDYQMPRSKRKRNQGRHYENAEWVEFVADGIEDDGNDVDVTPELRAAADEFETAVDEALEKCFKKYPPKSDPTDLYGEPGTASDIYFTLSGAGVGIWDGRWDAYYPGASDRQWQRITSCLREHLSGSYDKLESEFMDAAFANNPSQKRARNLARKLTR